MLGQVRTCEAILRYFRPSLARIGQVRSVSVKICKVSTCLDMLGLFRPRSDRLVQVRSV
jgi:hypothetical protein